MGPAYLESTILVASDLVVAVTVPVKRCKHNTEGPGPLAEENEEMVPQRLLREEEAPVVDCTDVRERKRDTEGENKRQNDSEKASMLPDTEKWTCSSQTRKLL